MGRPVVVVDFDGTLAEADVGDELCDLFGDPGWRETAAQWRRGELSLPEAQRRMWATVKGSEAELRAAARRFGLRSGAESLFEAARGARIELIIASGGFGLYVEEILGPRLQWVSAAYYNTLLPAPEGSRVEFPHHELKNGPYSPCKAKVLARHARAGERLVFCGDGSSDRSVTGSAAELFVVAGSLLESHCNEAGVSAISFTDFSVVLDRL